MGVAIATASRQPLAALCSFLPPPSFLQDAGRGPTRKEARGQVHLGGAAMPASWDVSGIPAHLEEGAGGRPMLRQRSGAARPCRHQVRRGSDAALSSLCLEMGGGHRGYSGPASHLASSGEQASVARAQNKPGGGGEAFALGLARDAAAPPPSGDAFSCGHSSLRCSEAHHVGLWMQMWHVVL